MRFLVISQYIKEGTKTKHCFSFVQMNEKNKPFGKPVFISQDKKPLYEGKEVESPYTCEMYLGPARNIIVRATGQEFTIQEILQIKDCRPVVLQ